MYANEKQARRQNSMHRARKAALPKRERRWCTTGTAGFEARTSRPHRRPQGARPSPLTAMTGSWGVLK